MRTILVSPIILAAVAAALPAQLTITDGNMSATTDALSATSQSPRSFDLLADALAVNHAYEHWWYYRVAGDTSESALRLVGTVNEGVVGTTHIDRDFADVDSRGLLRMSLDMDTYSTGPASGVVISRLNVMNISNAPVTFDIFAYTDLDVTGSSGNDSVTGNGSSHVVTDPSGVRIEVRALGNDKSEVGAYPTIRNKLINAVVDDLSDALPPFAGDYTGAFQWQSRTLAPFAQTSFQVLLAVDTAAFAAPVVEYYGVGNGSNGEIQTDALPLQDNANIRQFSLQLVHALPFTEFRIGTSVAPINAFPIVPGIDMWVDPGLMIGLWGGFTDANGFAQESFLIPTSPYLTGFTAYTQGFYVDGAAPNGFVFYTTGLATQIGKL